MRYKSSVQRYHRPQEGSVVVGGLAFGSETCGYFACAVCPPPYRYFTVRSLSTFSYHTIKCNPTSQCRSTLHVLTNAYCPLSVDGGRIPVSLNQSTIKQRATRTVGALSLVSLSLSVSLTHDVTSRGPAAAFVG